MSQTFLYGSLIQSGSIPASALAGNITVASATSASFASTASTATSAATATSASFAATASNITGGTANYIPVWSSATIQSSSAVYQLGTNIGINTTQPSASLHVSGGLILQQVYERVNITASAPPVTLSLDLANGAIFYRSASTAANWTVNFRGDATTPLNDIMYTGQVLTATVLTSQASTPYSASTIQIDGRSIVPRWQGGVSSSVANGLEANTYTIIKLASASYNLLASITRYT
jgi:hypothetical protein